MLELFTICDVWTGASTRLGALAWHSGEILVCEIVSAALG